MSNTNYDRLPFMDASFLIFESENSPLHVAATVIYEAGPFRLKNGGIDVDRFRESTRLLLHRIPRYRQKLAWIPVVKHPVWVDDEHFELDYHIRHTSLPQPGSIEQLKKLSARIMAQPLDHARPLWESWVVEGLEGDRFAWISKLHHCMIDGSAGQELAQILMSPDPEHRVSGEAPRYFPRPAPSERDLLRDEMGRYAGLGGRALRGLASLASGKSELRKDLEGRLGAFRRAFSSSDGAPSQTPLNGENGPHRRFDWLDMSLADVKAVRRALGCTVNDVVLAIVSGAVRDFLLRRSIRVEDLDFRVSAPVSIRSEDEKGEMGNRVSMWYLHLPIDEKDPLERVERIHAETQELKESKVALDADAIMGVVEWTPTVLMSLAGRASSGSTPYNLMVTNVPGPQFPLYLEGAKMLAQYAQVPLADGTALGVALVSYDGKLFWGFNADYELVPDLEYFVKAIATSFNELARAAGVETEGDSAAAVKEGAADEGAAADATTEEGEA
ncbi:MAG: wax ester/triacylglycerol synthase family O-acyltransferase [Deltaproteobacteria bacterium]|nr:wax ester/triacylglycerol synthase family O-acyltransferase [Deltaproteobacteria bacterium]